MFIPIQYTIKQIMILNTELAILVKRDLNLTNCQNIKSMNNS